MLCLSYPIHRAVLQTLQPLFIELFRCVAWEREAVVRNRDLKKGPQQKELLGFFQELNYLYPDMHLFRALHHFQVSCDPFDEAAIGKKLKNHYMVCWNTASYPRNPPNGEYLTEDEDTIAIRRATPCR